MHWGSHITRRTIAALGTAAALAVPAQAGAATASLSGATLNVNSGSEASDVTVTISGPNFVVSDAGADVAAGTACVQTGDSPKKVTCPTAGVTAVGAVLNGEVDKLDTSAVPLNTNVNSGAGADKVTTGSGADALNGDVDDDALDGGLGNDNLIGGGGGDTLVYTSHAASVTAHLGANQQSTPTTGNGQSGENDMAVQFEYLQGGSGNDTLTGDGNDNFISGGLGNDTINGGAGHDYVGYWERTESVTVQLGQGGPGAGGVSAGGETDVIATDIESAMGGSGDDVIVGNDSDNVLWGGWSSTTAGLDGNDILRGKGGSDYLWGDEGVDTADYSDKTSAQPVTATLDGSANDGTSGEGDTIYDDVESITGGAGADNLSGNTGPNTIRGGAGNDTINAFGGDDVIDGGTGGDSFTGGPGIDRADYSSRGNDLTIDLDGVADDAGEGDNVKTDVEHVTGGSGNDTLTGSSAANALDGGPGADTLRGGGGADAYTGGAGTDTVDFSDKLLGTSASIDGVANDGGDGDNVGTDVENLVGSAGVDTLTGDGDANALSGAGGNDTLNGAGGDDKLQGGMGADTLNGGEGADNADYGDKTSAVAVSLDNVSNDPDGDTIAADVENATGGAGPDTLTGNAGANVLSGGVGNDSIDAGEGSDAVHAGDGDDTIAARDGAADTITCGIGADSGLADTEDALADDCESTLEKPAPPPVEPPVEEPPVQQPPVQQPPVEQPPVEQPPVEEPVERDEDDEAPVDITTPAEMVLSEKGDLKIGVSCTADAGLCKGTIELIEQNGTIKARSVVNSARRRKVKKGVVLGRKSFSVPAGRKKNVQLRLDRRGRQRVIKKKKRKTRAKLVITMRAADGTKVTTEKNITIQPPKERRTSKRGGKKRPRR
jgi:Ca2+-binding RTX toxin-like protein